ncbi:MAG: fluoride efflux transporter CrcB [Pseudomonadota bacterium]|nr:fluoride efflux transporter CrcB [Pseudomonadota bacterium]
MNQLVWIAAGGAAGSVGRFLLAHEVYRRFGAGFPWGTLAVNVLGSLAIGVIYMLVHEREWGGDFARLFLLVGLLGGFTTFSTFSIETVNLLLTGEWLKAVLNMLGSVLTCVAAAALGVWLARSLWAA